MSKYKSYRQPIVCPKNVTKRYGWYTCLFCFLIITGCREGSGGGSPSGGPVDQAPTAAPYVWDGNVNLYLENSHSMEGYFRTETDFYKVLDNISAELNRKDIFRDRLTAYTIADTEIDSFSSVKDFRETLDPTDKNKNIAIGKSSQLDVILEEILRRSGTDDVSILITDGIMSGTNEQLDFYDDAQQQKFYNKTYLINLENDIMARLDDYSDRFALNVLAFRSNFSSTKRHPYFKLDNNRSTGMTLGLFTRRPFYLIVIGSQPALKEFEIRVGDKIKPERSLYVGLDLTGRVPYRVTSYANRVKSTLPVADDPYALQLTDEGAPYTFNLLIDDGQLPRDIKLAAKDFVLLNDGEEFQKEKYAITLYNLKNGDYSGLYKPGDEATRLEIDGFSHQLSITLEHSPVARTSGLTIGYRQQENNWYEDWSSVDDLNVDLDFDKTFGFANFISGMRRAYREDENTNLFTLPLTIKKQ